MLQTTLNWLIFYNYSGETWQIINNYSENIDTKPWFSTFKIGYVFSNRYNFFLFRASSYLSPRFVEETSIHLHKKTDEYLQIDRNSRVYKYLQTSCNSKDACNRAVLKSWSIPPQNSNVNKKNCISKYKSKNSMSKLL